MTTYEIRMKRQAELNEELARVKKLLATRGIFEAERPVGDSNRLVKVETPYDNCCKVRWTFFRVPKEINLEKVAWWFVNGTKYGECTVYMDGHCPTTVRCDADIKRLFK